MERIAVGRNAGQAERLRAWQQLINGDLADARDHLEHVRKLYFETGQSRGMELKLLGDVLRAQGDMPSAHALYERYLNAGWPKESSWYVAGVVALAQIAVDEGHLELGETKAREAIATCQRTHDEADASSALVVLSRALIMSGRYKEAQAAAQKARSIAEQTETIPDVIDAQIANTRAAVLLNPGDVAKLRAEVKPVRELAHQLGLASQEFDARLTDAELATSIDCRTGLEKLSAIAREARARGFMSVVHTAAAVGASTQCAKAMLDGG
jgi:ATP/maltotriose-dependent transcriptional regulator MalT